MPVARARSVRLRWVVLVALVASLGFAAFGRVHVLTSAGAAVERSTTKAAHDAHDLVVRPPTVVLRSHADGGTTHRVDLEGLRSSLAQLVLCATFGLAGAFLARRASAWQRGAAALPLRAPPAGRA